MQRHVTIKEVAQRAGVGIATVSRVLNNSARVDPRTREKVTAVMRRLGYRPNAQGRRLVKRSTEMVCFVLSNRDFMNPFHSGLLYGAERFLGQAGLDIVFTSFRYAPETPSEELPLPRILQHRGIADGVILAGTNYPNLLAAMDRLQVPYVFLGNNLVNGGDDNKRRPDAVYFEECASACALAELLAAQGHQAIWFVADTRQPWFRRRQECYRRVMREHGLTPQEYTAPYAGDPRDYGVGYGSAAAAEILRSGQPFTAIMAGNDGIAYGVWRTLNREGIRVPGDVSLVGFDDVQEAHLTEPPLTTVHVPTERLGEECARLLTEKLKSSSLPGVPAAPQQAVVVPTEVIERGSCAPPLSNTRRAQAVARGQSAPAVQGGGRARPRE